MTGDATKWFGSPVCPLIQHPKGQIPGPTISNGTKN